MKYEYSKKHYLRNTRLTYADLILDPAAGVWWGVDPKAEAIPSMNPYNSMGNNPTSNIDPEGDLIQFVVGGLINGINGANDGRGFWPAAGQYYQQTGEIIRGGLFHTDPTKSGLGR